MKVFTRSIVFMAFCFAVIQSFQISADEKCFIDDCVLEENVDSFEEWKFGNYSFTATFYPHIKHVGSNSIFSPLSLQLALSMSSTIAYGETLKEIVQKVSLPEELIERNNGIRNILQKFDSLQQSNRESVILKLANGAWISSDLTCRQDIEDELTHFYQASLRNGDFLYGSQDVRKEINSWVEQNTQSQIKEFIPEGGVNKDSKFVLVNTLFMRAPWKESFDSNLSYEAPFYGLEKSLRPVYFMKKIAVLNILQEHSATIVELPFESDLLNHFQLVFLAVLPDSPVADIDLHSLLTKDSLDRWIHDIKPAYVDLSLPKFKVTSSIDAKSILQKIGLHAPFSKNAQFNLDNAYTPLVITDIFHNASFEIDEIGGEGSAATGIGFKTTSISFGTEPTPIPIIFDRPFLFVVADKCTGLILFAGHVMQPQYSN